MTGTLLCISLGLGMAVFAKGGDWPESTPEEHGLSSDDLAKAIALAREKQLNIHSLLVIRHGVVVLDAYFYPFAGGILHDVASVTKSVTSALVGIAIDQGKLKIDQPVWPLLGSVPSDARKQKITVKDLLNMSSGLDCGIRPGEAELAAMKLTPNWVESGLSLPVLYAPGERFSYCSPGFHLLSACVSAATGANELEFARNNLFKPLGIQNVIWPADAQGRTDGWGNLHLLPRDMAKIGLLYLRGGNWERQQVVSSAWVRQSIAPLIEARAGVGYGYGWWSRLHQTPRVFEANGRGGQRITVLPDEDMIVVITGGGFEPGVIAPLLFQSIRAKRPLPKDAGGWQNLQRETTAALREPAITASANLPATAAAISEKVYRFQKNSIGLESMAFTFHGAREARLSLRLLGFDLATPMGLDGDYRTSPSGPYHLPFGARGKWDSDHQFSLDLNLIANINRYAITAVFNGHHLALTVNEASGTVQNLRLDGSYTGH